MLDGFNQFHGANLAINSDVDQDTFGQVTKHNKKRQPRGQPFPSRRPQGYNEQTRQHNRNQHEA